MMFYNIHIMLNITVPKPSIFSVLDYSNSLLFHSAKKNVNVYFPFQ